MRSPRWFFGVAVASQAALALAAGPATPTPTPTPATAAEWMPHELIVNLSDLPRAYSCNDLWYRFHDVLAAIGARESRILTYDCRDTAAHTHASPKVELKFQFPTPLSGADTQFADFTANASTVRFAPGSPRSLTADDCEFMKQMTAGLLQALDLHPEANFRCAASAPAERFAVTVRVLLPAT
jgi:hypothetical protein